MPAIRWIDARPADAVRSVERTNHVWQFARGAGVHQMAIELDQQVVGAAAAVRTADCPDPANHPWSRVDVVADVPVPAPNGPILRGCGAMWRDVLSAPEIGRVLLGARKAVVQQLGLQATVSVVRAAGWPQWRGRLTADAYIQQVHAGGVDDPVLSVWLANGWMIDGFKPAGDHLQVVVVWENRAR